MNAPSGHNWLPRSPPEGGNTILLCFPHAGARWTVFRDWGAELSAPVTMTPADYPRDPKSGAMPFRSVEDLVAAAHEALAPALSRDFILFGHSLGAVVAYELAKLFQTNGPRDPLGVIVSGRRGPGVVANDAVAKLAPDAFLERVLSWGGFAGALRQDPDLIAYFARSLRADMALAEAYEPALEPELRCPLAAFSGLSDDLAPSREAASWSKATRGPFHHDILPGDHFFPFSSRSLFLSRLDVRLREIAA